MTYLPMSAESRMLIPLRTDAPVYHTPFATIGVITLNVFIQIWASATDYRFANPLLLHFGSFMPNEWLTSAFMHAGWMHLIGNMLFLWVFGLVIEGKVGWKRFISLYCAIAVLSGMVEQILMIGGHGHSLGASGVIFGLLAISMVWAPENEIDCVLFLYGLHTVELSIKAFAALYIILQFIEALFDGFGISSALLHLIGAACGLPMGIFMLRRGWVDCEGWDWFTRRERNEIKSSPTRGGTTSLRQTKDPTQEDADCRTSFISLVHAGSLDPAMAIWRNKGGIRWGAPAGTLELLVNQLLKANRSSETQPFIDKILIEDPGHPRINLLLAQLLIRARRPSARLACLDAAAGRLEPSQSQALCDRLRAQCLALQAEGVLEIAF